MVSKNGRPFIPYICKGKHGCGMNVSTLDYDELLRHSWEKVNFFTWKQI